MAKASPHTSAKWRQGRAAVGDGPPGSGVAWPGRVPGWLGRAPGWHETPCGTIQSAVLGPVTGRRRRFVPRLYLTHLSPGRRHTSHRFPRELGRTSRIRPANRAGPAPSRTPAEPPHVTRNAVGNASEHRFRPCDRADTAFRATSSGAGARFANEGVRSPTKGLVRQRRARFANAGLRLPTDGAHLPAFGRGPGPHDGVRQRCARSPTLYCRRTWITQAKRNECWQTVIALANQPQDWQTKSNIGERPRPLANPPLHWRTHPSIGEPAPDACTTATPRRQRTRPSEALSDEGSA